MIRAVLFLCHKTNENDDKSDKINLEISIITSQNTLWHIKQGITEEDEKHSKENRVDIGYQRETDGDHSSVHDADIFMGSCRNDIIW